MKTPTSTVLCLAALLLGGCGPAATPPPPTPTPSPVPTATATLTPTPPPTNTPTATPDRTATQSAKSTEQARKQSDDAQAMLAEMEIPTDSGRLGFYQTSAVPIFLSEHSQWNFEPFAEDLKAGDFVISTEVTWTTDAIVSCGFFFRSENDFEHGDQYLFEFLRLSGLPAWHIAYLKDGKYYNEPSGLRFSDALDQTSGATNTIVLVAKGGTFDVYINDHKEGTYYDYSEQRADGKFAFSAMQDSGTTICLFANTVIWVYE
jgi:hypothetical protein